MILQKDKLGFQNDLTVAYSPYRGVVYSKYRDAASSTTLLNKPDIASLEKLLAKTPSTDDGDGGGFGNNNGGSGHGGGGGGDDG